MTDACATCEVGACLGCAFDGAEEEETMRCEECNGTGRVAVEPIIEWSPDRGLHATPRDRYEDCETCEGSGEVADDIDQVSFCLDCDDVAEPGSQWCRDHSDRRREDYQYAAAEDHADHMREERG